MRIRPISLCLLLALLLSGCVRGQSSYFAPTVAVVNGQKVPESRISFQLRRVLSNPESKDQFKGPNGPANRLDTARQILNQAIQLEIALQFARENGLRITDAEIDQQLTQLEQRYGSRKAFEKVLTDEGLTIDEVIGFLTEQTLFQKVATQVTKDAAPSEQDLRDFYTQSQASFQEQVHAAHILVCADLQTGQCAFGENDEATARSITTRARAGEDFAKLAQEFSKDPSTAPKGGDLGFFGRGQMAAEFEQAAFGLQNPGDISDPVRTQFGFHVIKLLAKGKSFEEAKEELSTTLGRQRQQQAYDNWLEDELRGARIRVDPRYGRFDRTSLSIVPLRASATRGTPPNQP